MDAQLQGGFGQKGAEAPSRQASTTAMRSSKLACR